MSLYIMGLFLSYMVLNVFTDLKYRKTKNIWHFIFLIVGLGITYFAGIRTGKEIVIVLTMALVCGLLLETFKFSSPGDTKMLVVAALYVSNVVEESAMLTAITLTAFHLLFFWIASIYRLIKILGFVGAIKDQLEHAASIFGVKLPKKEIKLIQSFPGACSILLGAMVYIAFTIYQNGGILV
ncbi:MULTISPECIES: hypothetical protein [Bacillus cereus group]|uniref:hypothetical protein n=1 Tax=Bacillus cereus group TaxID=86661 RepID=UPI000BECEEB6|nr:MULTISPECIES: hypothetical protein [Bacillus cereus group]PDY15590.1 hypothetical protein COM76_28495 [Bacillus cereus]PET61628.1 hypothetical protein CN522_21160 [Bacillus cereus]PEU54085.1 hypothetical protein CN414_18470 [Bacillus cereus]PEX69596.1 hypothetical protein CN457_30865 [Bacillus cereus]PFA79956.1 hypothetical protein CN406_06405 [Bacillus cereus]